MRQAFIALVLLGLAAAPAAAQGRGNGRDRIAPGQLPVAGECRVWYDGVPPGRQPRPTSCAEAERIAARDRNHACSTAAIAMTATATIAGNAMMIGVATTTAAGPAGTGERCADGSLS